MSIIDKRNPHWKRLEKYVHGNLLPQMSASAVHLILAPKTDSKFDLEFAIQIGAAILLEKPMLVLKERGRDMPPKLERIADRIIEVDKDGYGKDALGEEIKQFFRDFGKQ